MPLLLATHLTLGRCPHCNIDRPNLSYVGQFEPADLNGMKRHWRVYVCARCAGVVVATALRWDQEVRAVFPPGRQISDDLPPRARAYLEQAFNSLGSPAGAVMLAASAVDAMLKAKGLTAGSLYTRIDEAAGQHLLTQEMSKWAHEVRLDANDQRHSDDGAPLPDQKQAEKCVEFAAALGEFMFSLPARVQRGRESESENKG